MKIYNPTGFSSNLTGSFSGSVKGIFEGSFTGSALTDISGAFDSISSSLAAGKLNNTTDTLDGDLTVTGTITAQEFHTQFVSASIIYQSGSTQFGDSSDDTHTFTGTGSFDLIGVGTASPAGGNKQLTIYDNTTARLNFNTSFTSVGNQQGTEMGVYNSSVDSFIWNYEDGDFYIGTNNNKRLTVDTSGSIGIGTSTPESILHVHSSVNEHLKVKLSTGLSSRQAWYEANNGESGYARFGIGDNSEDMAFFNTDQLNYIFYVDSQEKMRLDISGSLGIGTTPSFTSGSGIHLADHKLLGFGNGNNGRPDFQIGFTDPDNTQLLGIRCGNGADDNDIVISPAGNLGVGMSSDPAYKLQVGAAASINGVRVGRDFSIANRATLRLDSDGTGYPSDILFGHTSGANEVSWTGAYWALSSRATEASNRFYIYRASGNPSPYNSEAILMSFDPSLKVGIGSDAPTQKLDVGGVGIFGDIGSYRSSLDGSSSGAFLRFGTNVDIDSLGTIGTYGSAMMYETDQGLGHIFKTGAGVNGTERMRIDSSGNITQTASDASLSVNASNAGGTASISINGLGTNGTSTAGTRIDGIPEGSGAAASMAFVTRNSSGTRVERMRIDSSGNVGIGTTNPNIAKLHVVGSIYSTTSIQGGNAVAKGDATYGAIFGSNASTRGVAIGRDATPGSYPDFIIQGTNGSIGIGTDSISHQLTLKRVDDDAIQIRRGTTGEGNPAVGAGISWTWNSAGTNADTWAAIRAIFPGSGNTHLTFSTTPSGGETNLAERMRIDDNGRVTKSYQPFFEAYNSGAITVTNADSKLTMNAENVDVGGVYDVANYRFTAPVAGRYLFTVSASVSALGGGTYNAIYIRKNGNGTSFRFRAPGNLSSSTWGGITGSAILNLAASDYIELYAYTQSGSITLQSGETRWCGYLLG